MKPAHAKPAKSSFKDPGPALVRRLSSRELLGGASELVIEHAGRAYRLRVTQNDKLILTA